MILEIAQLPVRAGEEAAFEAAFDEAQKIIAAQPGYRSHELVRGADAGNGSRYVLLVRWDSVEAHDPGFRQSAGYQTVARTAASLLRTRHRGRAFCDGRGRVERLIDGCTDSATPSRKPTTARRSCCTASTWPSRTVNSS